MLSLSAVIQAIRYITNYRSIRILQKIVLKVNVNCQLRKPRKLQEPRTGIIRKSLYHHNNHKGDTRQQQQQQQQSLLEGHFHH